jgi:type II secretory pathway component HofQ
MDSSSWISLLSACFAAVSGSSVVGVVLTRRNRAERAQDMRNQEALKEKTVQEATDLVLSRLRQELEAAYADVERRRLVIQGQDERIEKQNRVIRRQSRRIDILESHIRALEHYINDIHPKLVAKGIDAPEVPSLSHDYDEETG